jgi:hypothetical protein
VQYIIGIGCALGAPFRAETAMMENLVPREVYDSMRLDIASGSA